MPKTDYRSHTKGNKGNEEYLNRNRETGGIHTWIDAVTKISLLKMVV